MIAKAVALFYQPEVRDYIENVCRSHEQIIDCANWAMDSHKYLLDEIHELYSLIDNGVLEIPNEWRAMTKKYLLQSLFTKLEDLEKYCEETDVYFENYGGDYAPIESTEKATVIVGED